VGNVTAYTNKLMAMIQSESERERLAQAAYQKVKNCYSVEVVRNKLQLQLDHLTNNLVH
jgi:spore maturation protein CgeB